MESRDRPAAAPRPMTRARAGSKLMLKAVLTLPVAFLALALPGGPRAEATTGTSILPAPEHLMPPQDGDPFLGRFYLMRVGRIAHIVSAQLDVAVEGEGFEPEWFYGELKLRLAGHKGRLSTAVLILYNFQYANERITAEVIKPGSINEEHRRGIPVGTLSFALPESATGISNKAKEVKHLVGSMHLNGRTFPVGLKRGSDDAPPPNPLPRAKQVRG